MIFINLPLILLSFDLDAMFHKYFKFFETYLRPHQAQYFDPIVTNDHSLFLGQSAHFKTCWSHWCWSNWISPFQNDDCHHQDFEHCWTIEHILHCCHPVLKKKKTTSRKSLSWLENPLQPTCLFKTDFTPVTEIQKSVWRNPVGGGARCCLDGRPAATEVEYGRGATTTTRPAAAARQNIAEAETEHPHVRLTR